MALVGPRRGQALVEFALVFPIIMLIVLAGIEWAIWQTAQTTARFAAQSGSLAATVVGAPPRAGYNATVTALQKGTLNGLPPTAITAACSLSPNGHPCGGPCRTRQPFDQACSVAAMPEPLSGSGVVGISSFQTQSANGQVIATVVVEGWIPAPVPLPFTGAFIPVQGYAQLPVQGVQG